MKSLSVSSFVEYMVASPSRRTAILRNAIEPPTYIVDRYGVTYKAFGKALCEQSCAPLLRAEQLVELAKPKSIQQGQRIENTLQSLGHAKRVLPFLFDSRSKFANATACPKYLDLGGVAIKVVPQALAVSHSDNVCGVTRVHCSKNFRVAGEVAQDYATVLYLFAEQSFGSSGTIDPKSCIVVDVFAETFSVAPKNILRRKKKIVDTCEEISDRWDGLANRLGPKRSAG